MSWTRIWNEDGAILNRAARNQDAAATFLLETRRAVSAAPLWSGSGSGAILLNATDDGAVDLRLRDIHLRSEPGMVQPGEAFRLVFRSVGDGHTTLEMRSLDRPGIASVTTGFAGSALLSSDFVPAEPLVSQFGGLAALANHNAPQADKSGLQVGCMVATPAGERPVETLQPGDIVITAAGTPAMVQQAERAEMVTLGSMNAVRLRAPYFGLKQDAFVTRQTQIRLSGADVEYSFGTDQVTAAAGDLVNGRSVIRDLSEPVREFVTVELDRPGCLALGRLPVAANEGAADCPAIDRVGTQSLLAAAGDIHTLIG